MADKKVTFRQFPYMVEGPNNLQNPGSQETMPFTEQERPAVSQPQDSHNNWNTNMKKPLGPR